MKFFWKQERLRNRDTVWRGNKQGLTLRPGKKKRENRQQVSIDKTTYVGKSGATDGREQRMKKKILSTLLAMALTAAALSGCGNAGQNAQDSEQQSGVSEASKQGTGNRETENQEETADKPYAGTTVLMNLNTPSESVRENFDAWLEDLQARVMEETGIELKVEMVSWGDYLNKHLTSIASQEGPDIIQMGSSVPPVIAAAGGLLDLTPYMDGLGGMDVYCDVGKYYCSWDGKMIAIPWGGGGREIYFNKDIFDAAGLEYPDNDWTLEEFEHNAKALTEHMGKPALALMGSSNDTTYYFWSQLVTDGGAVLSEDMTKARFNEQEGVDAVMRIVNMYKNGYIPSSFAESTVDDILPTFINGEVAMAYGSASWWQDLVANMEGNWGTVAMPVGKAGLANGTVTMSAFGIMSYTKNPEAAAEVLKILASPEEIVKSTAILGWIPFRTDLENDPAYADNPAKDTFFYVSKESKAYIPQYQAISTVLSTSTKYLNSIFTQAVTGEVDEAYVRQQLDALATEVDNVLAEN